MAEWKIIHQSGLTTSDTTETAAEVNFAPGPSKEWRIISVRVRIATGSSGAATCYPLLQVRDSGNVMWAQYSPPTLGVVGVSDTGKSFLFSQHLVPDTAFIAPDSLTWNVPIPEIVIPKDWNLNIALAGSATNDSQRVWMQAWSRPTL